MDHWVAEFEAMTLLSVPDISGKLGTFQHSCKSWHRFLVSKQSPALAHDRGPLLDRNIVPKAQSCCKTSIPREKVLYHYQL